MANNVNDTSGSNKWWWLICVITRLSIKSERNFSDFNNYVYNSYNSGNVYDVYGYGYVTWHRFILTSTWSRCRIFLTPIDSNDDGNDKSIHYVPVQLGNRVIRMILARFEAPDADGIHVIGVDEEVGGGRQRIASRLRPVRKNITF